MVWVIGGDGVFLNDLSFFRVVDVLIRFFVVFVD